MIADTVGSDTIVRKALIRGRIVQIMRHRRDASSMGRIGQGTEHSRLFVWGHIGRGRNTLHPYRCLPLFSPTQLDKTPIRVVFLAPLSSVVRILQAVPFPRGMTWRKYKLLILPNASFSDGPFQAYCTVCLVAKTGIVNKTD
jgi:hypothetical protein